MITAANTAPRIALVGFTGVGKTTLAKAIADLLRDQGVNSVVLKLAAPLYELQRSYYDLAGLEVGEDAQDQQLLHRIATDLRRVSPTSFVDRFRAALRGVPDGTAVINDDLRDADVDAPGLREAGFTLVRVSCAEPVRATRLAGRGDLSRIDEREIFGPAMAAMSFDYEIDTLSADPRACARQVLEAVGAGVRAPIKASAALRAASTGFAGARDTTHVWGEYVQTPLDSATLLREILVYPGGRTSIHRHKLASELNIIAGGAVRLFIGDDPSDLAESVRSPGDLIHVPAGAYHAVAFEQGESSEQPCARFFEVVYSYDSADDIERIDSALPGARPCDSTRGYSGWIAESA
ncbi:hypothetical protein ACIP5Y_07305 [Nocardia sp. NPDC088792]|uniref:phosphotransferase-like protein n=1 Tax=Nocardia sp. NPDC088792 TaxID=3364332 RepID=UPI00382028EC